ncbi:MAG: hypothetical protein FJ211_04625 [Ignavibacteria bacterium]|nr:hypothetical protein [Ignavibacteria bacterium]
MIFRQLILCVGLLACTHVSAQIHSSATGVSVREIGLHSVYARLKSGRHVLAHPASIPLPSIDTRRDVLQYEFYAPENADMKITVNPRDFGDRVTLRSLGTYEGTPVWVLMVDLLRDVEKGGSALIDSFSVSVSWDRPHVTSQYSVPPTTAVFLNPTWRPRTRSGYKKLEHGQGTVDPRAWYDSNGNYVGIHTSRDGLAVVPADEILKSGGSVPLDKIALFWRGLEQPILIDDADSSGTFTPKDLVFFQGRRAQGDSTYFDTEDSVSVFFLTTNAPTGQRKRFSNFAFASNAADTTESVFVRKHFEQDTGYYHPGSGIDDDHSIFESSTVFLEGFYWKNLYGRSKQHATFTTRFTPAESGTTNFTVHYATTTANAKYTPEHLVGVWSPARQAPLYREIDGYQRVGQTWSSQSAAVPSGTQRIIVQATGTDELRRQSDWYSEVLVDAIEIYGDASPVLDSGRLHCTVSNTVTSLLKISNVHHGGVYILDTAKSSIGRVVSHVPGYTVRGGIWSDIVPDIPWDGLSFSASVTIGSQTIMIDSLNAYALITADVVTGELAMLRDLSASEVKSRLANVPPDDLTVVVSAGGPPDQELVDDLRARGIRAIDTESQHVWIAASAKGEGAFSNDNGLTAHFSNTKGTDGASTVLLPTGIHHLFVCDSSGLERARTFAARNQGINRDSVFGDIIAIAHRDYLQEASRWAKHRFQMSGKSIRLYDVDAVFEEYDAGRRGPQAIRAFLSDAFNKSQKKPTHCVLIGNASWDARLAIKGGNVGARRANQVPTYGRPSTDMWFGLLDDEQDVAVPELIVTRLPAATPDECRSIVDKIITTDTLPYQPYMRKFLYVGGGTLEENFCDMYRRMLDDSFGSEIVFTAPPLCIDTVTVCNTDYAAPGLEIRRKVNDGVGWMNYIGHGGTDVFDITDWDPEDLQNGNRYPILATFSCLTGNYSSPNSACENASYLTEPNRGVVAAMGSTGYQYLPVVDLLHFRYHEAMLFKGLRSIGDLTYETKRAFATMGNQIGRNAALQYCVLGDPFTRLRIDTVPDLRVYASGIVVQSAEGTPSVYAQQDSFRVAVDIVNSGVATRHPTAVIVRRYAKGVTKLIDSVEVTVPQDVCSRYQFYVTFPTGEAGDQFIHVQIDPRKNTTEDTLYKQAWYSFSIVNRSLLVIDPDEYGVVDIDSPKFRVLYPYSSNDGSIDTITFSIHGSKLDAEQGVRSVVVRPDVIYSRVYADVLLRLTPQEIAQLAADRLYWLRAGTNGSGQTIRPFSFKKGGVDIEHHVVFADYMAEESDAVQYNPTTQCLSLAAFPVPLNLQSSGAMTADPVRVPSLRLGFGDTLIQSSFRNGINVAVIRPFSRLPRVIRRYDTSPNPAPLETGHSGGAAECIAFLKDSILPHEIVAVAACNESFTQFIKLNLRDSLARVLNEYGSSKTSFADVGSSYVFVGSRDPSLSPMEILEQLSTGRIAVLDTVLLIRNDAATLRPVVIERPRAMKVASHTNGDGVFALVGRSGYDNSINLDTMYASWTAPRNSSTLKSVVFTPTLRASDVNPNPQFRELSISYVPAPMLLFDSTTINVTPRSSLRGDSVEVEYSVRNLHVRHSALGMEAIAALRSALDTADQQAAMFSIANIPPDQRYRLVIRGRNDSRWSLVSASYRASMPSVEKMLYPMYGNASITYKPREDVEPPVIEILANSRKVLGGDYVDSIPTFLVKIIDASSLEIRNEDNVVMFVNGVRIRSATAQNFRFIPTAECNGLFPGESVRAAVQFDFPMERGENLVIVRATDASGNKDTTEVFLIYKPEPEVTVVRYGPNPTTGAVSFTVSTAGQGLSAPFMIRMHDAQGRIVLSKELALPIGTSSFVIDAETQQGSSLAPGVYLWSIVPKSNSLVDVDNTTSGIVAIVR